MAKTTFEEIEPVMADCTKAEVTSSGAPWVPERAMVNNDPTKGYYLTSQEFDKACQRIATAFNEKSGNGAAGFPVDLSDKKWQEKYAPKSVETFNSAASIKAATAAAKHRKTGEA